MEVLTYSSRRTAWHDAKVFDAMRSVAQVETSSQLIDVDESAGVSYLEELPCFARSLCEEGSMWIVLIN